jgi:protocatechuate 3,4-dioxygenase alpha subunit
MSRLGRTPSQTVGPYHSMRLSGPRQNVLVALTEPASIRIEGRVYDGDRKPVDDALIEAWQANAAGRYRHGADDRTDVPLASGFLGFGRATVDPVTMDYRFETVKPGRVPAPDGSLQAPHINLIVHARGLLNARFTRLYFADEAPHNATDAVLGLVPEERRRFLVATVVAGQDRTYRFDIRLRGPDETVFFEF